MNHILLVDILWLQRLSGNTAVLFHSLDQILFHDFDELRQEHSDHDDSLVAHVELLNDDSLSETIDYRSMMGPCRQRQDTVQEILSTMFTHQTHHRGQIHAMFSQSGIKNSDMPDLDLVDYLDFERESA